MRQWKIKLWKNLIPDEMHYRLLKYIFLAVFLINLQDFVKIAKVYRLALKPQKRKHNFTKSGQVVTLSGYRIIIFAPCTSMIRINK